MIIDDNENEDKKNEQKNFVYTIILKFHAKFLQNAYSCFTIYSVINLISSSSQSICCCIYKTYM